MKAATAAFVQQMYDDKEFQSTPPVKAATSLPSGATEKKRISIHAAREGGDGAVLIVPPCAAISIHAAREGGDLSEGMNPCLSMISIHAAREGGDRKGTGFRFRRKYFNPRRP